MFNRSTRAQSSLRNPVRRALSFKEVAGFGVYQCNPSKGYHKEVELDRETEAALGELWRSYNSHKLGYEGRWLLWIHQHFNNSSKDPEMGRLVLELKLRWSVYTRLFSGGWFQSYSAWLWAFVSRPKPALMLRASLSLSCFQFSLRRQRCKRTELSGYMYSDHGEIDEVAEAEAAWVIAWVTPLPERLFLL